MLYVLIFVSLSDGDFVQTLLFLFKGVAILFRMVERE